MPLAQEERITTLSPYLQEAAKRRTSATISHPDAGKTIIIRKVLLFRQAIRAAGTVKGRGSNQHAKSDWMGMERQRGISVATSVVQLPYCDCLVSLLDTPGHKNFLEGTYRTLTAMDCCLMIINAVKGVKDRTHKLVEVTRLRDASILTLIGEPDHDTHDPMELPDEAENGLKIGCAPVIQLIGCSKLFKGAYHLYKDEIHLYQSGKGHTIQKVRIVKGLNSPNLDAAAGEDLAQQLRDELKLVKDASNEFDRELFLAGETTPVFFDTALDNFGTDHMLDGLAKWAPAPVPHQTDTRTAEVSGDEFTDFVFRVQTDMDPKHRDRVVLVRMVPGKYEEGMELHQVRTAKDVVISDALTFMVGDRLHVKEAHPGDILDLHNHDTIQTGDTFTRGEMMRFTGISSFAPGPFRRIRLKDSLKQKQSLKELVQLSGEGTVQVFRLISNNDLIVDTVGVPQFDVVVAHLRSEYNVEVVHESVNAATARWVECAGVKRFGEFERENESQLALNSGDNLTYIATNIVNLRLVQEHYPDVQFHQTHEH